MPYVLTELDKKFRNCAERIAIESEFQAVSYAELERFSHAIFTKLNSNGVGSGHIVGVFVHSRLRAIATIIAILRNGCSYLPLDPVYPKDRLQYMLRNAGAIFTLYDNEELLVENTQSIDLSGIKIEAFKTDTEIEHAESSTVEDNDLAYIIYTSGSTGKPKGIMMPHAVLGNLIQWQNSFHGENKSVTKTAQFSSLSFDVSFQEIFSTLCAGGTIVLVDEDTKRDFRALLQCLDRHSVARIFMPFVALQELAQWANRLKLYPQNIQQVITAGEQLIITRDIRKFFSNLSHARLTNQYGPSESHVVTEFHLPEDCTRWPQFPPIGKPIDGAEIMVLDENLDSTKVGEVGEIFISGKVLAQGYINNSAETNKRFIRLTINHRELLAYRSGDTGFIDQQGQLHFKGRIDSQVKINGYRVELSEIEAAIMDQENVSEAAVVLKENVTRGKELHAFITSTHEIEVNIPQLLKSLRKILPQYMIPTNFHTVPKLLKTASGKIDRQAMLSTDASSALRPDSILNIICRELGNENIDLDNNLVDVGMDSLAANRIAGALYDNLGLDVPAYIMFQHRSIADLINRLLRNHSAPDANSSIKASHPGEAAKSGSHEIAIIGMAVRVPGAASLDQFWQNLLEGKESIHFFEPTTAAGEVNARGVLENPLGFDADFFNISPVEARFIDPQQRLLLELAWSALENAGYTSDSFAGRIGVYCGTGNNSYYLNQVLQNSIELENFGAFQAMIANEKDFSATRIAYKLNLNGPAINIQSACSTSLVAICQAVESIRSGDCDMAVAGASSLTFPQEQKYRHEEGGIYSVDGHTRTFDQNSSGTVFSDGGGMVVLKRLDYALADNDRVVAVIKGVAVNNDGIEKGSFSAPSIEGQKRVIQSAQTDAGLHPDQFGLIEAHGTATPIGDPIEVAALTEVFRNQTEQCQFCALGSIKSNFGHLTAAAGVVGLIKSALSLQQGVIPPSINFSTPNPALQLATSPFKIQTQAQSWKQNNRVAGVSSFGIGGTNSHVVLSNYLNETKNVKPTSESNWMPFCISSKTAEGLDDYIKSYKTFIEKHPDIPYQAVIASSHLRHRFAYRMALSCPDSQTLYEVLKKASPQNRQSKQIDSKNTVFLFPGQGSQTRSMGKSLYKSVPYFQQHIDSCEEILKREYNISLVEMLFDETYDIDATENTQVALFSVSYALARTLLDLGIQAQATVGHSIGELASACLADVFDLPTALKVVVTRGRLMQRQHAGNMVAVRTSAETLLPYLSNEVVLAADNAPSVCTISGPGKSMKVCCENLIADGIEVVELKTSHAFHSPMMDGAVKEFAKELADISLMPPQLPFISCVSGDWIKPEEATDIHYWARQISQPVQFRRGLLQLQSMPDLLLIECGPKQTLSNLALQVLRDKEDFKISNLLGSANGNLAELIGFTEALGELWIAGVDIEWPDRIEGLADGLVFLPGYPFQHQYHGIKALAPQSLSLFKPANQEFSLMTASIDNSKDTSVTMENSLTERIKTLFTEASGIDIDEEDQDSDFFELGFDSLFMTQSILKIKKTFQVSISFRDLVNEVNSINLLAQYLREQGVADSTETGDMESQPIPSTTELPPKSIVNGIDISSVGQQMQLIGQQLMSLAQPQSSKLTANTPAGNSSEERRPKPFGAGVRINVKRSSSISDSQQLQLDALSHRYTRKFAESKKFTQDNRRQLADPRVVSGFRQILKEIIFPIVVKKSSGAYLWDLDGNKLVDITCGFGSNFFGHGAEFVREAVARQLQAGYEIGPQHPLVGEVSQLFCEMTKSERVAFCNTGSEAVLGAVRLARTVTAKETLVMFANDYHGINDEVVVHRGHNGLSTPAAAGIPENAVNSTVILDYGEEQSLKYIRENSNEIAAILVEPVQSRNPTLQPKSFLHELRKLCDDHKIALIFDEVITGFRLHPEGAQGYFGVKADLATYGKVVGGGMPIGLIAGKRGYMDALDGGYWSFGDDSAPEVGVTYFAGTFVRHPLALAAAQAILTKIKAEPGIQDQLNQRTDSMIQDLNSYSRDVGSPVEFVNCGSLFRMQIPQDIAFEELIYVLLREKGVHIWDARPCFLTTAHTSEDIQFITNAFKQALDEMLAFGFLPRCESSRSTNLNSVSFDANSPPVKGARLGTDPQGNPAWYIQDPENSEKYMLLDI